MPGDLVDFALRRGSDAQNRSRAAGDLRAAGVVDDLRAEAQADGLRLQHQHVLFAVDLERDLGLTQPLPALQHGV